MEFDKFMPCWTAPEGLNKFGLGTYYLLDLVGLISECGSGTCQCCRTKNCFYSNRLCSSRMKSLVRSRFLISAELMCCSCRLADLTNVSALNELGRIGEKLVEQSRLSWHQSRVCRMEKQRLFIIIKFSPSDNAFRLHWLVHSILVISSYTLVWPYTVNDCAKRC